MLYYSIALLFIVLSVKDLNNKYKRSRFIIIVIVVFLSVFAGIRDHVGYDFGSYEIMFLRSPGITAAFSIQARYLFSSRIEPGYLILNSFVKSVTTNFMWQLLISSLIICSLIIFRLREYTPFVFLGILLYFTGSYLGMNFGLLRQGIASSLFFFSIKYVHEKHPAKYYLLNLIACLFHYSAVVLLPFYFILNRRHSMITRFVLISISLILSFFDWATILLANAIPLFKDYYVNTLILQTQREAISLVSVGTVLKVVIFGLALIMRSKLQSKFPYYNIMLNMYTYYLVFFLMFRQNFVFGARVPIYFSTSAMVLATYFQSYEDYYPVRAFLFLMVVVYSLLSLSTTLSAGVYIPYISILGK